MCKSCWKYGEVVVGAIEKWTLAAVHVVVAMRLLSTGPISWVAG